ncbi:MAG: hypothetical protein DI607_04970 [Sphingomonas hengshuiensis]|nr:MAG: hypothetical protein DI607_04970 [Sphingomonas hengshuiensis]
MQFVRKAGNLYVEGWNQWLGLKRYQLPTPRVKTETHSPGGGIMDLDIPLGSIEPLTLEFDTLNASPDLLGSFGMHLSHRKLWTIYELLQDEKSGTKRERIITGRGIVGENTPEEMAGRGVKGYGHVIKSITDYEDVIEGYGIVARFSFFTNSWSGYGISAGSEDDNRILRINGG